MNVALLALRFEEMGGTTYIYFTLATHGRNAESDQALRERWTGLLNKLFPAG